MRRAWVARDWAVVRREVRRDLAFAVRVCWLWEEVVVEERGRRREVERRREEEERAGLEADRPEEEEREEEVMLLFGEGKSGSRGGGIVGCLWAAGASSEFVCMERGGPEEPRDMVEKKKMVATSA